MNTSGAAPVPPSPPSMLTKSTPRPPGPRSPSICLTSESQNSRLPTADLMPTGSPVSVAISSTKSSIESASLKTWCRLGDAQSWPGGMPRISAISRLTLAAGSMPPSPGFAPCESLTSMARTGADATTSLSRARSKRPCSSRQPKYDVPIWKISSPPLRWYGASAPSPVFCRQPAASAPRLSASTALPGQRAEAHARDVHHRRGAERLGPAARRTEHLGHRHRHVLARVPPGQCARAGEGPVLDDRGSPRRSPRCCRCRTRSRRSRPSPRRRPSCRWSRLNGRSSSFEVTMYWRSSGPNRSSANRRCPTTGKLRRIVCCFCVTSCAATAPTTAAAPAATRFHLMGALSSLRTIGLSIPRAARGLPFGPWIWCPSPTRSSRRPATWRTRSSTADSPTCGRCRAP